MRGKTLFGDTSYFRAFPDAKDVFATRVRRHAAALLPVGTLSLRYLSRRWEGYIHFVLPIEPCAGCGFAGDGASEFCNSLCRPNWIGYRLLGEKCELACDFRFFRKALYEARPPQTEPERAEAEALQRHYHQTRAAFRRRAEFYREQGWLSQWPDKWTGNRKGVRSSRVALVRDLGGASSDGNWANTSAFPKSRHPSVRYGYDTCKVYPQTEDGREFHFIGSVEMWNYLGDTNGIMLLFYDPEKQVALTTVDWS